MKSTIAILIHIALAIFVIVAIWPALQVSNDEYVAKPVNIVVEKSAPEAVAVVEEEPALIEEAVAVMEPVAVTPEKVDAVVKEESAPVAEVEAVVAPETVEEVPEVADSKPVAPENDKEDEMIDALYSVVDGNKLDAESYAGFKLYRNWCARCHGTYGQGMVGPNLADSLKIISEQEFFKVVEKGKSGTIGSMPAWRANAKVMAGRDQLYAYLMARSDGAIGQVKPKKQ